MVRLRPGSLQHEFLAAHSDINIAGIQSGQFGFDGDAVVALADVNGRKDVGAGPNAPSVQRRGRREGGPEPVQLVAQFIERVCKTRSRQRSIHGHDMLLGKGRAC
jgi:hypothetical protein